MIKQEQEKTGAHVGILVVAFPEENAADEALKALKQARKQKKVYFEDAAVVRQDAAGSVQYHETGDMSMGKGAGAGALLGGLFGLLGGPPGIVIGAGAGALIGGALAHEDAGFDDKGLQELGVALKPNSSAVALVTSTAFLHDERQHTDDAAVRYALGNLGRQLFTQLEQGKSVALGMALSNESLIVSEVAADETSAAVISILIAEDSVLTGEAVVNTEGAPAAAPGEHRARAEEDTDTADTVAINDQAGDQEER